MRMAVRCFLGLACAVELEIGVHVHIVEMQDALITLHIIVARRRAEPSIPILYFSELHVFLFFNTSLSILYERW